MHMATTYTFADEWIAQNTSLCLRFRTRLTLEACRKMRQQAESFGDLKCEGCRGLDNQPEPFTLRVASPPKLLKQPSTVPKVLSGEEFAALEPEQEGDEGIEGFEALDDAFADLSAEQLEALCPGLSQELAALFAEDEESEPEVERRTERREANEPPYRKVAVFMGRCRKCGGYMINALERHDGIKDDEVYRCFTCGWRTSPVYEFNRRSRV